MQENSSEQTCSYWYVDNETKTIENETETDADCKEIQFEKVGPNYNNHLEDNSETESNDELDETTNEQKESFLPEETKSLQEDLVKNKENEEKPSDAEVLFGNEVNKHLYNFN